MTHSATREVALAEDHPATTRRPALLRFVDAVGWPCIRRGAVVGYALTVLGIVVFAGVPTGRVTIAILTTAGVSISRWGTGWRSLARVFLDWLPFTAVLLAYDRTRAVADAVGLPVHEADVLGWERALFGGHVPTVWLQQRLYSAHHVHWWDALATLIYVSHFLATPVLAAILWLRDRALWAAYASRVVLLSAAGLLTYVLFPEAPPWLASRDGLIVDHVARLSARGWIWLHAADLKETLERAQQDGTNPVAAMPSLHVALACLVTVFVASRVRRRWHALLWLYPLAMGAALVYLGEHYVVDLAAGLGYAVAAHLGMAWWERRRLVAPGDR